MCNFTIDFIFGSDVNMNDDVDIPVCTDINEEEEEEEETGDASQEAASGDSFQEQKEENSQQLTDDVKQEAEDTKTKEEDKGSFENSVPLFKVNFRIHMKRKTI